MIVITAIQFVAARFSLREDLTASTSRLCASRRRHCRPADCLVHRHDGLPRLRLAACFDPRTPGRPALSHDHQLGPDLRAGRPCRGSVPGFDRVLLVPAVARLSRGNRFRRQRTISIAVHHHRAGPLHLRRWKRRQHKGYLVRRSRFRRLGHNVLPTYALLVRRWAVDPVTATAAIAPPVLPAASSSSMSLCQMVSNTASIGRNPDQIVIQGFLAGAAAIFLYTYVGAAAGAADGIAVPARRADRNGPDRHHRAR